MPTDRRVAFWPRRRAVVDGDGGRGRQGGGRDRASRAPRPAATATAPAGRPPSLRGELEVRPSRRRGRLLAVQTDQIYCVRGSARTSLRHRAPSHGQQVRRRHVRSRRPAAASRSLSATARSHRRNHSARPVGRVPSNFVEIVATKYISSPRTSATDCRFFSLHGQRGQLKQISPNLLGVFEGRGKEE